MTGRITPHSASSEVEALAGYGINRAAGTTVPSDGAAGYAIGCIFQKLDGGATTAIYVNVGTNTSANFDPVTIGGQAFSGGATTITASSANALAVGPNGTTNPTLNIVTNVSSEATGVAITGAAAAAGVAIAALSSGTDESLTLDAKGAGVVTIAGTSTGGAKVGSNATDRVVIKGIYMNPAVVAVTVPSITDPDIARVQVSVAAAFSIQPAVGDALIAIPMEALPTNCRLQGAFVYTTDGVEICFGSEGGNVTGAAKNFNFLVIDLT